MPLAIPEPYRRPLPHEKITPQNTALLVIDMQNDFCAPGAVMETPGAREMVPAINRLADFARKGGLPVIWTYEMHRPDKSDYGIELEYDPLHCLEGSAGVELVAGLQVAPGDHHLRAKRRYDCFHGTELDLLLRANRIENLMVCGVTSHQCVMSTVFSARHRDYRVLLAQDACAGVSAEYHAAAMFCMSDVFAYVTDVPALLSLWPA
jgi:nicotinamidase-related amidase